MYKKIFLVLKKKKTGKTKVNFHQITFRVDI